MTLDQLTAAGIARFLRPVWADPAAYARIDLTPGGFRGPWMHLYDRRTQEAIGEPTPQHMPCVGDATDDYEPYHGEPDPADTF